MAKAEPKKKKPVSKAQPKKKKPVSKAAPQKKKAKSKRLKVCIDRVLPQNLFRPQFVRSVRGSPTRAIIVARSMWPNGSTLRVRFIDGTSAQRAKAREQALWWTEHANLTFDFNDALDAEIRVSFNFDPGRAWSWVGTESQSRPLSEPTMNLGFLDGGTAGHEFGHALGMAHEHQSPFGGMQWNEEAVIRDLSGPPNSWTEEMIRHNVLEKYTVDQIRGTQFDPDSIMLYFFPARWTLNGVGTEENDVLSEMDKQFIASEQAYPRTTTGGPLEIGVNSPSGTDASIGEPGEEDLFIFKAETDGRYKIETGGQSDVVMKLFGPESQTRLIAEDDDSGPGLNSRIVRELIAGDYFVQIRHFNRTGGTGSYDVRVTKEH
jgi:hypothetical protein